MMTSLNRIVFYIIIFAFPLVGLTSTISPYKDLGHLSHSCDAIYLAKAKNIVTQVDGEKTTYFHQFEIVKTIKGSNDDNLSVKYFSEIENGYSRAVSGEIKFEPGTTYLLFLRFNNDGTLSTECLSYYLYEEVIENKQSYLVPVYQSGLMNISGLLHYEPNYTYHTDKLIKELSSVTISRKDWNAENARTEFDHMHIESKSHKAIPSHCNLVNGIPPARWKNMNTSSIPVFYQSSGSGCSNIATEMNSAVNYLSNNYVGTNIYLAGTYSGYNPNCAQDEAWSGNFQSFVDNNLGQRSITVIFNDPCNEMNSLNNCSGQVALGGVYSSSITHVYNGETYRDALYGFVVVNNSTGSCACNKYVNGNTETNYSLIMTHELTHAIGLAHHDSGTIGNMSASACCSNSSINSLDKQCIDYIYNPPIEPDLFMSSCGSVSVSSNSLSITNAAVRNGGNTSSNSSTLGYYISTNNIINTADTRIGIDPVGVLGINGTSFESFSYNYSNLNLTDGTYYIGMIADYNNQISESSENNNSCLSPTTIQIVSVSCNDGIRNGSETGVDCGGESCQPCNCEPNAIYSNNINQDITRHAQQWITTSGTVQIRSSSDVFFLAENFVLLNEGFEVLLGSSAYIDTENCN